MRTFHLLRGDVKALSQVFQHLFVNSIESANSRKHRALIKVRVVPRKAGSETVGFRLAIADNGAGISEDDLDKGVFTLLSARKRRASGSACPSLNAWCSTTAGASRWTRAAPACA